MKRCRARSTCGWRWCQGLGPSSCCAAPCWRPGEAGEWAGGPVPARSPSLSSPPFPRSLPWPLSHLESLLGDPLGWSCPLGGGEGCCFKDRPCPAPFFLPFPPRANSHGNSSWGMRRWMELLGISQQAGGDRNSGLEGSPACHLCQGHPQSIFSPTIHSSTPI